MNAIIRYLNQNREKIIVIIAIVAFFLLLIQLLNQIAKNNNTKLSNEIVEEVDENLPIKSIISGQVVSEEVTTNNIEIIEKFINKCNEKDIDGAYELLTDDCKETLFATKEEFINNYYNRIFTEKRIYGIENFINIGRLYTYKVKFYNDALSTGNVSDSNIYLDYITINKDSKISINNLITTKVVDKITKDNEMTIKVIKQEVYKDYERYQIEIKNNTDKNILLDTNNSTKTLYAINSKGNSMSSYINEIPRKLLILEPERSRNYTIKFNKLYSSQNSLEYIILSDVVMDYDAYELNPKEYKQRKQIQVEL